MAEIGSFRVSAPPLLLQLEVEVEVEVHGTQVDRRLQLVAGRSHAEATPTSAWTVVRVHVYSSRYLLVTRPDRVGNCRFHVVEEREDIVRNISCLFNILQSEHLSSASHGSCHPSDCFSLIPSCWMTCFEREERWQANDLRLSSLRHIRDLCVRFVRTITRKPCGPFRVLSPWRPPQTGHTWIRSRCAGESPYSRAR